MPDHDYPNTFVGHMVRAELRKRARQGNLVDTTFKVFSRAVFPNARPEQVHVMRTCFFAGAAEIFALFMAALDEQQDATEGDVEFMDNWVRELRSFHEKTLATASSPNTPGKGN